MFDWNDLRYFLAVARSGSTIAAAKALGVSQPTVQRRLAALEKSVGRKLVERHPMGCRLTKLGEHLRSDAEGVEQAVAAFERRLMASGEELTGTIHLTCAEGMAPGFVTPLIAGFRARHPGIRVDLIMTDKYLDLAKGEADIAVRASDPGGGALLCRKIADAPWALYASRSYMERHHRPARVEDLDRHAVIDFGGEMRSNFAAEWLRTVAPRAAIPARGNTMLGILAAVKSGAGLAPLPMMLGEPEADLVRVFDSMPALNSAIYLVVHPDLRNAPRIRAFFDFVVAEIDAYRPFLLGGAGRPERDR